MKVVKKYIDIYSMLFLFSFFIATPSIAKPTHEYHVSVTQMQYNSTAKTLEVSIRIFTDDLELALSQTYNMRRFVIKNNDQNNSFVENYIKKHFVLRDAKENLAKIIYLGKEEEADATWIYLEIPFTQPVEGSKLTNKILVDVFMDQVNMTNLKLNSQKKTYLFKKGQTTLQL